MIDHLTLSGENKNFMVISVIQVWGKLPKRGSMKIKIELVVVDVVPSCKYVPYKRKWKKKRKKKKNEKKKKMNNVIARWCWLYSIFQV